LTLAFDFDFIKWAESENEIVTNYDDATWKAALEPSGDNIIVMHWNNAVRYRFGAEYVLNKDFAFRLGYYYDPSPIPNETYNILFPSSTYNVVTAGVDFNIYGVTITGAAEYLFGTEREINSATSTIEHS
jgi:long-chain fatty acid transport protein